jgi:putrescine transport system permease protein
MLSRLWMAAVYGFLYLPIVSLVVYSFTDSSVPNVWGGFSLRWYQALTTDTDLKEGLWLSLQIATSTATAAVVLGSLAAASLHRYPRFFGRTLFSGMVSAPLVMPEVIVGLSLLLMLVSLQRLLGVPERGMVTIWLGHLLLGMAYATVVIHARLKDLNPQLEEAAQDLGAKPWQVFFLITIPMIAQALLSAWLLTFMPLVIFSRARLGLNPSVNAIATVVVVIVAIGVAIASYMIAQQERRRANEMAAAQRFH